MYLTGDAKHSLEQAGMRKQKQKHTTGGIPRWSPTLVLVARFSAYVWQSGRDAQFSLTYGRMCLVPFIDRNYHFDSDEGATQLHSGM